MRSNEPLSFDAAESWKRMQGSEHLGKDLEDHFKDLYRQFLDKLMIYDRQEHLQLKPYERQKRRHDQANGFYSRYLTSSFGTVNLRVPRTRSGKFQTQVIERYQRRTGSVDQAIKEVFLSGVSTRQTGAALAGLLGGSRQRRNGQRGFQDP